MKYKLFNQRGLTLIELLATIVILMLIIGPMLSLTFSLFSYSLEDGERNQTASIGQQVMEEIKLLIRSGQYNYTPNRPEYSDYDIDVEIIDFPENNNLKEINVIVKKKNSSFEAVALKTVVRKP